jgi:transcriptional regulator with GAF, ATPase, and Fis domain
MLSHLEVLSGAQAGLTIHPKGPAFDIGRSEDNDLVLSSPAVLPRHTRVLLNVEGGFLEHNSCAGKTTVLRGDLVISVDDATPRVSLEADDVLELSSESSDETVRLRIKFHPRTEPSQIFETRPLEQLGRFPKTTDSYDLLGTLSTLERTIVDTRSFQQLLTTISDAALRLISRATHVTLVLREDLATPGMQGKEYVIVLCRKRDQDGNLLTDDNTPHLVRSVFRRVVDDRAAILAADAPTGNLATESLLGASIQSTMAVPLWHRDDIIGVLQLDNRAAPAMFDRRDLETLGLLATASSLALFNSALERRLEVLEQELRGENRYLRHQAQPSAHAVTIVGKSEAMRKLLAQLERVAKTRATVLIEGETGVGKELVAAQVHASSPREGRLFVAQNCGAIPENLLESELFGHKRGAFTGASDDKKGLFELADGGTLFLDEVTEMSLGLQAKLLRALQEGEIRPLGSTREKQVNVRIIAACNRNLEKEVEIGRFRQDLYFRLKVFPLVVPPLRERRSDVPLLATHFFERYTKEYRKPLLGFSEGVLSKLSGYSWPGNVRELENEVQRLVIQADDASFITLEHLSVKIRGQSESLPNTQVAQGTLKEMVEQVEKQLVMIALREHGNNKTATAKALGMTREGFHKKLRLLGLKGVL